MVKKGSKILALVFSSIPQPSSRTSYKINVCPWRQHAAGECRPDLIRIQVLCSNPDKHAAGAILSNGFTAIDDQMHDELLDLTAVCFDRGQIILQVEPDGHGLRNRRFDERADLRYES